MLITVALSALADVGLLQEKRLWTITDGIPEDIYQVATTTDIYVVDAVATYRAALYRACFTYRTQNGLRWAYYAENSSVQYLEDNTPDSRDFFKFYDENQERIYFYWLVAPEYYYGRTNDVLFKGFKETDLKDGFPTDIFNATDKESQARVSQAIMNLVDKYHDVVGIFLQNDIIDGYYYQRGEIASEHVEFEGGQHCEYWADLNWFRQYKEKIPYTRFFYYVDPDAIGSGEGVKQQCGDDLWWTYADGTLSITGSGDMWDYTTATLPWKDCKADITKVELPEGLTSISASAFARTQITEIAIPDGVRFIESSTFDACRALTTVQLPAELINIGNSAFMSCSNLKEVKGLSSASNLRVVEEAAFYDCSSLKEAVFPTSLERLGNMVFSNCTSLERVGINGSVTQLGSDVFANCSSLKDVELNAPISIIGSHCFSRCSSLEVIDLPATLTSIGYLGFYACSSLKKVICRATTPPGLGENAFWQAGTDEITYQSASRKGDSTSGTGGASGPDGMDAIQGPGEKVVLYVPVESIALYQTAEGWKEFKTIDDITNVPGGIFGIKTVGLSNRKFFTPKDGIIILRGAQRYNTQGVKLKK